MKTLFRLAALAYALICGDIDWRRPRQVRIGQRTYYVLPQMAGADDGGGDGGGGDGGGDGGSGDGGGEGAPAGGGEGGDGGGDGGGDLPWGDGEFDEEKAKQLIRGLRSDKASLQTKASTLETKVQQHENEKLSEKERLEKRAKEAEAEAAKEKKGTASLKAALKVGLTGERALALSERLVGETDEELEADAKRLIDSLKPSEETEPGQESGRGRPTERLRPGAVPSARADENDPAKLADEVPRGW